MHNHVKGLFCLLVDQTWASGYKHTYSYLVDFFFFKDISFVLFAQLLAPHFVSLELVLHNAHAQSADFIVTHHTMKLGETVEDRKKKHSMEAAVESERYCSRRQACVSVLMSNLLLNDPLL